MKKNSKGFVLIEVLIAVTILSVVLLSVYSGISSAINVISNSRNYTEATVLARSLMNEFRINKMRGADMHNASIENKPGFRYDRVTKRYESPFLGPLIAQQTDITVKWDYRGRENEFTLTMVYQLK
jgi:prepilin-type N-terminal cleavage/methylation domain-containing protein